MPFNRLKTERIRRGWSQQELGFHSGIGAADISRIETGRLVPGQLQSKRLGEVLGLDPEELQKSATVTTTHDDELRGGYIGKADAAAYLGISVRTLEGRMKSIPHFRIGAKKLLFKKSELDGWMEQFREAVDRHADIAKMADDLLERLKTKTPVKRKGRG